MSIAVPVFVSIFVLFRMGQCVVLTSWCAFVSFHYSRSVALVVLPQSCVRPHYPVRVIYGSK